MNKTPPPHFPISLWAIIQGLIGSTADCGRPQQLIHEATDNTKHRTDCDRQSTASSAISALKLSLTLSPLVEGGKNVKVERRCRSPARPPAWRAGLFLHFKTLCPEHNGQSVTRFISTYSSCLYIRTYGGLCGLLQRR